jgi:hypothetical protein
MQGVFPHPPSFDLISYYLNFLAGAGYLCTAVMYMWADEDFMVTATTYIEMSCRWVCVHPTPPLRCTAAAGGWGSHAHVRVMRMCV